VFKSVTATSVDDPAVSVTTATLLAMPTAKTFDREGYAHDLAAFAVADAGGAGVLELAAEPPKKGDPVWLAAEIGGSDARLHPAQVELVVDHGFMYSFAEKLQLRATSGAPVVDARGHVVGINLAGGPAGGGKFVGAGGSVATMRAMLAGAAQPSK
jgi:hypothetical protein